MLTSQLRRIDMQTGLAAAEGKLVVPALRRVVAYR